MKERDTWRRVREKKERGERKVRQQGGKKPKGQENERDMSGGQEEEREGCKGEKDPSHQRI